MDKPEIDFLKCQVPGCNKKWTVFAGWKKCSDHAWTDAPTAMPFTKVGHFDKPPTRPFTEIDDDEPY